MWSTLDCNQWIGCYIFLLLDGLLQLLCGLSVLTGALLLLQSCWLMVELAPGFFLLWGLSIEFVPGSLAVGATSAIRIPAKAPVYVYIGCYAMLRKCNSRLPTRVSFLCKIVCSLPTQ
ncbi:hypothetical protein Nepgr_033752 [Nepenthes gracilis]|uniref:Uncharacterized protein n=1 Tax=Nepenthes gracilis TaxID=150966 RepID=A0AAD3TL72_NEPGR|nr:hypothetical protein Nepgr_033752 [Nepenthes gracilis]